VDVAIEALGRQRGGVVKVALLPGTTRALPEPAGQLTHAGQQ
jgi:hypothetical protein